MTKIKVSLENVRLIDKAEVELFGRNLYFVTGDNEKGKSSFIKAVTSLMDGKAPKDMLTNGKENGEISGVITGADGDPYRVTVKLKEGKNPAYTIITPELKKSTKKGDLDMIFDYHHMTVEKFMGLGLTEPGRRKQAEFILNVMPRDIREEVLTLDDRYQEKYKERTETGNKLKWMKENSTGVPDEKDEKLNAKLDQWEEWYNANLPRYEKAIEEKHEYDTNLKVEEQKVNSLKREKQSLEEEIKALQARLDVVNESINNRPEIKAPQMTEEVLNTLRENIDKAKDAIANAKVARQKIEAYKETGEKIKSFSSSYEDLSKELTGIKERKTEIITANIDIPNLDIEDGQLVYKDDKGSYPVNEDSLSFSRGTRILVNLLSKINSNYPIIPLGKAREMGPKALEELKAIAEEHDAIILAEWVKADSDLQIEVYEKEA